MGIIAVTTLAATPWQMGVLEAAESAAVLLPGLSAGVGADRYERRRILLVGACVRHFLASPRRAAPRRASAAPAAGIPIR
ncbi:MFS transporter [Streptomyces sp. C1-2]|uniref:MFS transporter n=1 Tax=Streptomyces sp. C1-2 TaxID=2720022 RepID=UPI00143236E3|nr:MFS transporter [Streptomyces sp. C1-2]NJP71779.1 hypothetical protein [Streptomyces sp. C1-2]